MMRRQILLLAIALVIPSCGPEPRPDPPPTPPSTPPPDTTAANTVLPPVTVSEQPGAINVYFNKSALTQYALPNNVANQRVNLEERLDHRLSQATQTIDFATYETN